MRALRGAGHKQVEAQGLEVLGPFLKSRSDDGQLLLNNKGLLAQVLQSQTGDAFWTKDGELHSLEFKCERRWTGNLFLETWSNRNLEDRAGHIRFGSNPGWMYKLHQATLLLYYFLDRDLLYVIPFLSLKRWAFGCGETPGEIYRYPEKRQIGTMQSNDSWGRIVPIRDLTKAGLIREYQPKALLSEAASNDENKGK